VRIEEERALDTCGCSDEGGKSGVVGDVAEAELAVSPTSICSAAAVVATSPLRASVAPAQSVPGDGFAPAALRARRRHVQKATQTLTAAKGVVWMLVLLLLPLVNTTIGVGSIKARIKSSGNRPFFAKRQEQEKFTKEVLQEQTKLTADVLREALENER